MDTKESRIELPDFALIPKAEVRRLTSMSNTAIWRAVRSGSFPAPRRVSNNRVAWRLADVQRWIEGLPAVGVAK